VLHCFFHLTLLKKLKWYFPNTRQNQPQVAGLVPILQGVGSITRKDISVNEKVRIDGYKKAG
jgi:hypothetical protein